MCIRDRDSEEDKRIGEHIALLKLQASWSDMQAHNTKVLDFIKDYVLVVISCSDSILQQSDSVRMPFNPLFNGAASAVLDLEKSKPLMQCFFENQLLNQFVKAIQKLKDIIMPIQEGMLEKSSEKMSCRVKELEGFLVIENEFLEESAF